MDRDQALELLREQHTFPGPFEFRVVVRPDDRSSTVSAMTAGAGEGSHLIEVNESWSRTRKYVSLRVRMHCSSADDVLAIYDVLRQLDGILATL